MVSQLYYLKTKCIDLQPNPNLDMHQRMSTYTREAKTLLAQKSICGQRCLNSGHWILSLLGYYWMSHMGKDLLPSLMDTAAGSNESPWLCAHIWIAAASRKSVWGCLAPGGGGVKLWWQKLPSFPVPQSSPPLPLSTSPCPKTSYLWLPLLECWPDPT